MEINSPNLAQITFKDEESFEKAISPFSKTAFVDFVDQHEKMELCYDPNLSKKKIIPLNPRAVGKFDFHKLFSQESIEVYYPEEPRVSHQLTLIVGKNLNGIHNISKEDAKALHRVIKKINEIYVNKLHINGFVIASYSTPPERHDGKCMVEIHPHAPGFSNYRNLLDKLDANRAVVFGDDNLTGLSDRLTDEEKKSQISFWEKELNLNQEPLSSEQNEIILPKVVQDCETKNLNGLILNRFFEILENEGAIINNKPQVGPFIVKNTKPIDVKTWEMKFCAFCKDSVIERQKVLEYKGIYVLYNFRKTPEPGTQFLIVPKRHFSKTYDLTPQEIEAFTVVKKALVDLLKEKYPGHEVVLYVQDAFSVGQTVPHNHEQVVAFNPKKAALSWSMMSLNYLKDKPNVSDEEMQQVTSEFGKLLEEKVSSMEKETAVI